MKKILFFIACCASTYTGTKARPTNIKRLKLRVGDTKEVKGYTRITADPEEKVHIYHIDNNTIALTGNESGPVDLVFFEDNGEVTRKSLYVKPEREEPDVQVSFGWGGYPCPFYYSSDPFYDPLYGWWGSSWHRGFYPRHYQRHCRR